MANKLLSSTKKTVHWTVPLKVPKREEGRDEIFYPFKDMMLGGSRDCTFSQKNLIFPVLWYRNPRNRNFLPEPAPEP